MSTTVTQPAPAGEGSASSRAWEARARGLRPGADTRLVGLLTITAGVIGAVIGYLAGFDSWRLDVMQAADAAGAYLFLVCPVYCGLACWLAAGEQSRYHVFAASLPRPGLVWRSRWLLVAAIGVLLHLCVLLVMISTALLSSAVGGLQVLPLIVQIVSVPAFTALGALVGGVSRSKIAAPTVFLALLMLNTVFGTLGFRRISDVGTGSADFIDLQLNPAFLWPKLVLFAAVSLGCWAFRGFGSGARFVSAAAAVVAVVAVIVCFQFQGQQLRYRPGPVSCSSAGRAICIPQELTARRAMIESAVATTDAAFGRYQITSLPELDFVSRGAVIQRPGIIAVPVTAPALQSESTLIAAIDSGYAAGMNCPDAVADRAPADSVLIGRAVLGGWLQNRTGHVDPGSFPQDKVAELLALPAPEQGAAVSRLLAEVADCAPAIGAGQP